MAEALSRRRSLTLAALRAAAPYGLTTAEIGTLTHSAAVHSDIADLRKAGFKILCRRERDTPAGNKVFRYSIEEAR